MSHRHQPRERSTGRYETTDFTQVCARCGSTLATHEAESPHANYDLTQGPECDGFKKSATKKTK